MACALWDRATGQLWADDPLVGVGSTVRNGNLEVVSDDNLSLLFSRVDDGRLLTVALQHSAGSHRALNPPSATVKWV